MSYAPGRLGLYDIRIYIWWVCPAFSAGFVSRTSKCRMPGSMCTCLNARDLHYLLLQREFSEGDGIRRVEKHFGALQVRKKKAEKEALVGTCREERRTLEATISRMRDGISQASGLFARKQAELEAHEGAHPLVATVECMWDWCADSSSSIWLHADECTLFWLSCRAMRLGIACR